MSFDSGLLPEQPLLSQSRPDVKLRFRDQLESDKQKSLFFFSMVSFGFALAVVSVALGFMYGDYYGRQHAQFENPKLRDYYSSQCLTFINTHLKKTIRGFDKITDRQDENRKLDEIRSMVSNLQIDIGSLSAPAPKRNPGKDGKKKVAAAR